MIKGAVISTLHAEFKTLLLAQWVKFSFNEGCSHVSANTIKNSFQGILEQYSIQRINELVS